MTHSKLFSFALLFSVFALFSACQEEESGGLIAPTIKNNQYPSKEVGGSSSSFIAETTLYADEHITKILGNQGRIYFRIRPKGCPKYYRPLCSPELEFLSMEFDGFDPTRFFDGENATGSILDPKNGSVIAYLVGSSVDAETGTITLSYGFVEGFSINSEQLEVTFSHPYETGASPEDVSFTGEIPAEIIEHFH